MNRNGIILSQVSQLAFHSPLPFSRLSTPGPLPATRETIEMVAKLQGGTSECTSSTWKDPATAARGCKSALQCCFSLSGLCEEAPRILKVLLRTMPGTYDMDGQG